MNLAEIQRKANAGIALTNPTAESQKLYAQYQQMNKAPQQTSVQQKPSVNTVQPTNNYGLGNNGIGQIKPYTSQNDEIQRTLGVINNRQNAGLDTTQQMGWYKKLTGNSYSPAIHNQIPKQQNFQIYNPNAHVDERYIAQAGKQQYNTGNKTAEGFNTSLRGSEFLGQGRLRELGYYNQLMDNLRSQAQQSIDFEVNKGYGINEDWSRNNLSPIFSQIYDIEDYLTTNYGLNGWNNNYSLPGISRSETHNNMIDENGFRMFDTPQEFDAQKRLIGQGYTSQQAYEMVRGIDQNIRYSPTNPFTNNDYFQRLMDARNQALNSQSPQVQHLREIMAANGLLGGAY